MQARLPGDASSRVKVLHVDDEDYQLESVKTFLEQLDDSFEIHSITSPCAAMRELEAKPYDCLVIDFKMHEMDGLELAEKIREKSSIPIILYTGQGSEEVAEKAFSIGIDDYIKKEIEPSHYQILAKRIKIAVERRRMENLHLSIAHDTRDALSIIVGSSVVFANKALADLLGVENTQQLIGKNILEYVVPDMRKRVERTIHTISSEEIAPKLLEYDIKRKNGSIISVETSSSVIDYSGAKALLSFTRDVTERKEIEEARRKSEERFRSLVNLAPDGILTLDLKGNITFVNPSLLKLTRHTEEEIVGKWFPNVGTARLSDLPRFLRTFASIIRGKVPPPTEFVYIRKDGSQGWGEAHISLISVDGKKKEILAILSDITERKRLLEELENRSKQLEIQVEERTMKLLDSERMVAAGTVSAQIGHDLRGPLSTIRNAAYLGEHYPEKAYDMFRIINKAVDMSAQLLEELRTRTQETDLNLIEVDVNKFISNIIDEIVIPVNFKIEKKLNADANISIDIVKMKRVLDNILRNAIDAMSEGGVIIVSTDSDNESVNIYVKDTGCGIPEHVKENLFKPFNTSKANGTGLGLSFCKRIVEAHKGSIDLKSKVGSGSICSIRLPRIRSLIKEQVLETVNK